jgi:hypothetical protein
MLIGKETKMAGKTKIRVITTIKGYSKKKGRGLFGISVGNVKLTEGQRNKLDVIIDNADTVVMNIETEQENLPNI